MGIVAILADLVLKIKGSKIHDITFLKVVDWSPNGYDNKCQNDKSTLHTWDIIIN